MKQNFQDLLQSYLSNNVTPATAHLGPADKEKKLKNDESIFISRLESTRTFNNNITILIVVVLLALIIFLGILIWKNNNNQKYVIALLSGQGGSIIVAVNLMLRIKREKFFSDIIIDMLPKVTSKAEKDKLIESVLKYVKGK
ncbi:MAG TPA: hypothetical protein VHB54_21740 [Mucilaginibacter sp.]|nr:hypothetical protein [Mucilaginibacter sp.]HVX00995.1 hypothetical protein [Candidatus Babeliaceae bacterium]